MSIEGFQTNLDSWFFLKCIFNCFVYLSIEGLPSSSNVTYTVAPELTPARPLNRNQLLLSKFQEEAEREKNKNSLEPTRHKMAEDLPPSRP